MHTIPMLSWDFIHVGAVAWNDARQPLSCDVPRGIELRVEPARKTGPVFQIDRPWERGNLSWAQVMHDDGRYRMWYGVSNPQPDGRSLLCYAESDDGLAWRKPELGIIEVDGSTSNNVVLSGAGSVESCIVSSPREPRDKRYRCMTFKAWWEGEPGEELDNDEGHRRLDAKNAAKEGEHVLPVSLHGKMMGLDSPDGLHWTPIAKPVLDEWHDTHNICVYDEAAGVYRAYLRGFYGGRRAVSYSETKDFETWPPSRVIHHHLVGDGPDESIYSNGYTRYPGRPDVHVMFPSIYHQSSDTTYGQLAVSMDGINWSRFTQQAIIPHGQAGDDDEAAVYPEPELLHFAGEGKFRLLCFCGNKYHNEWYNPHLARSDERNSYLWAEWPADRLAGIAAAGDGEFTIKMQTCGDRMVANFRTEREGWVRFELVDRLVWPPQQCPGIEGFCFDNTAPMTGDQTHAAVCWNQSPDLSALDGRPVGIRVQLHKATLYSVTMYGVDDPLVENDPRYPV